MLSGIQNSSRVSLVSVNAGGTLGSSEALEAFLHDLSKWFPSWKFCYVSEFDGSRECRTPVRHVLDCRVFTHHPGPGSRSMGWIVRLDAICTIRDVCWLAVGNMQFLSVYISLLEIYPNLLHMFHKFCLILLSHIL